MRLIVKTLLFACVVLAFTGGLAFAEPRDAGRDDREERRNLRERRDKIRTAMKTVESCLKTGEITRCLTNEDQQTQEIILKIYMKRMMNGKKVNVENLQ